MNNDFLIKFSLITLAAVMIACLVGMIVLAVETNNIGLAIAVLLGIALACVCILIVY